MAKKRILNKKSMDFLEKYLNNAAPMPAIWPKGCMAKERKFPNRNPIAKNWRAKNVNSTSKLGLAPE